MRIRAISSRFLDGSGGIRLPNPKPEGRRPKEGRNSKSEEAKPWVWSVTGSGVEAGGPGNSGPLGCPRTELAGSFGLWSSGFFRPSAFVFRVSPVTRLPVENTEESWTGARGAFTLIEVVISSALMALIITSAYLCLNAAVSSQKMIEPRATIFQNARVAMALMTADLRCACPLSPDSPFLGMQRMLGTVQADNLDFATHNYTPRRPREGDYCQVSYFLDKDRESGNSPFIGVETQRLPSIPFPVAPVRKSRVVWLASDSITTMGLIGSRAGERWTGAAKPRHRGVNATILRGCHRRCVSRSGSTRIQRRSRRTRRARLRRARQGKSP